MGIVVDCTTGERRVVADVPVVLPVPESVTRFQFLTAIRNAGRANDLKAYIQTLANGELEAWQNRNRIYRASPMIEAARVALGVSQNAVNNLFIAASQIDD